MTDSNNFETMLTKDIVYRPDLYPRFSPNQEVISKYAESIELLPPIAINQNNILIDGYHRLKAHERAGIEEIEVEIIQTESEADALKLAYKYNSVHGLQLSTDEKKKYANKMIDDWLTADELADVLSVSRQTINTWTKRRREDLEEETRRNILDLYLHAENTQEDIAEKLNIPQQTVSRKIESFTQNANFSEMSKKLNLPSLYYTRWNLTHKDKDVKYFGIFPTIFMQHLLYYHTKPFDVVYDPFAGTGTTAEVCRQMYRRYYCSDLNVLPGTEEYIKQEDITNGIPLPGELPKIDLAFLDPPYWRQAKNKYSNSPNDLGNVSLDEFYKLMNGLIYNLIGRTKKIAIVIAPACYPRLEPYYEDHIFKFHETLFKKYDIEMRYSLPYPAQEYTERQVELAKKDGAVLNTTRDLVVWRLKDAKSERGRGL